ncbi:hypothetical protein POM88_015889 [Heracleum sosnowskyi]|uniref:RPN1 N-terminal domain-containing protein n=1 Tax=Heracleum sosnowskyi TaxID=360622 RepID=A0AAD8ILI7_9APIA|nr:hypothetical protein POM88_015889 [Heracleum sosnowskyi]
MTSVPKPLKFLCPPYGTLKAHYETMETSNMKKLLADILSVLALTMSAEGERGFTEPSSDKLLPDLHPMEQGAFTLVLDLNETLIYSDWKIGTWPFRRLTQQPPTLVSSETGKSREYK